MFQAGDEVQITSCADDPRAAGRTGWIVDEVPPGWLTDGRWTVHDAGTLIGSSCATPTSCVPPAAGRTDMATPRRYQFDNQLPVIQTPQPVVYQPEPMTVPTAYEQPPVLVQHIHQAPPDRTIQRVALGAGVGGGAVAAGVYFGPLLVAALSSMAISLAVVAFVVVVVGWGSVTLVRSLGSPDGKAAAENLSKARRKRG